MRCLAPWLLFTLAALPLSAQAPPAGERAPEELQRAAEECERLLAATPNSIETLTNLAAIRSEQGNTAMAVALLMKAATLRPAEAARYFTLAGDAARQAGQRLEAIEYYRQSTLRDPVPVYPRAQRLALLLDGSDDAALLAFADDQMRDRVWSLASLALQKTMQRTYASAPGVADAALLRWIDIEANEGGSLAAALVNLPPQWHSERVDELRALIADPLRQTDGIWSSNAARHAAASAVRSLAASALGTGSTARATKIFENAFRLAPLPDEYDKEPLLYERPIIYFDLAVELAALYTAYPKDLDSEGKHLRFLKAAIFDKEFTAYLDRDFVAMQRYHTALGMILDDHGDYTSPPPFNAVFQLRKAAEAAAEHVRRDPAVYQPLPDLFARLARAALAGGDADAVRFFVNAADAHLDIDDLDGAKALLDAAGALPQDAATRASFTTAAAVLSTRQQIAGLAIGTWVSPQTLANSPVAEWMLRENGIAKPEVEVIVRGRRPAALIEQQSFIRRQRFKAFTDLASRAEAAGQHAAAAEFYMRGYEAAVKEPALAGPLDIERLKGIESTILSAVAVHGAQPVESAPRLREADRVRGGHVWSYGGGSLSGVGFDRAWSADLVLAAAAAPVVISPETGRPTTDVIVEQGRIVVGAVAVAVADDVISRLRQACGTDNVSVLGWK